MKRSLISALVFLVCCIPFTAGATISTFEELTPPTAYTGPGGGAYYNGSDEAYGFTSGDAFFSNYYDTTYGSWAGFGYSTTTDTTTEGYTNQFSAYTGGGVGGSDTYAVGYDSSWYGSPVVSFDETTVSGAYITNTTYAALSMLNGDSFAKAFGGTTGEDEDWFLLSITGITASGDYTTNTVDFYLADYRFEDSGDDYIVDDWIWVDLSSLGAVIGLEFSLTSSDNSAYGMNTPAYFAMDNMTTVPVPAAAWLLGSGLLGLIGIRRTRKS